MGPVSQAHIFAPPALRGALGDPEAVRAPVDPLHLLRPASTGAAHVEYVPICLRPVHIVVVEAEVLLTVVACLWLGHAEGIQPELAIFVAEEGGQDLTGSHGKLPQNSSAVSG